MKNISLIVGLGNPGRKFRNTWHSLGAFLVEEFAKEYNFPKFKRVPKLKSKISEKIFGEKRVILGIPETYMNSSGIAVKLMLDFFELLPQNLLVIHDEIDLPLGKFKVVFNRGDAGHRGVRSIIEEIKTKEFHRIRVGILGKTGKPENLGEFVLQKISREEKKEIEKIKKKIFEAILSFSQQKTASGLMG